MRNGDHQEDISVPNADNLSFKRRGVKDMEELRHNSLTFEGESENKKDLRKEGPEKGIISRGHVNYSQFLKWTSDCKRGKRNKKR